MTRTRYVKSGDTHIAYRVAGEGSLDIVLVPNWLTDLESWPQAPGLGEWFEILKQNARFVYFDQPGTGMSDPLTGGEMPTLEVFVDHVRTVMDDAGMDSAVLVSWDIGTPAAIMFAATHPERTQALVILGGSARLTSDDGYPGLPAASVGPVVDSLVQAWGTTDYARFLAPSLADDDDACERVASWLRHALSPGMVRRVFEMAFAVDVRPLLPVISVPTLVFASRHPSAPVAQAQYIADHIEGARLCVIESNDALPIRPEERTRVVDEMFAFLGAQMPEATLSNRLLKTVLFTDIVSSTERVVDVGDRTWTQILDRHDMLARNLIARHGGRMVRGTGDGLLATFDGPLRAVRCAIGLRDVCRSLGLETRAALHVGEVIARDDDVSGLAIHIASRILGLAQPGEILVSTAIRDLVAGSDLKFTERGEHALRGVPDRWSILGVDAAPSAWPGAAERTSAD